MREAVKNSGHRRENHATEEAKRKITKKEFQTSEARKRRRNNSKNNRREKYLVLNHWRWLHFSADGNSASRRFFSNLHSANWSRRGEKFSHQRKRLVVVDGDRKRQKLPTPERRQNNSDWGKTGEFIRKSREASRPPSGVRARWNLRD